MRVLGADPSSASAGIAVEEDEKRIICLEVWRPPVKVKRPAALLGYFRWLYALIAMYGPIDVAVVEELSVTRGHKVVRSLSHFEGVTYLACEMHGVPMVETKAGKARNAVLGLNPNCSKEEVFAAVKQRWPELKLGAIDRGGGDKADALVMAKSWRTIARTG